MYKDYCDYIGKLIEKVRSVEKYEINREELDHVIWFFSETEDQNNKT